MNRQKWTFLLVALALIGATSIGLVWLKTNQRLGHPGIKTKPIASSKRLDIYLPEKVLDYRAHMEETDTNVLNGLPQDTSFARSKYVAPNGDWFLVNTVLMGTDRTSIHKPQFCLTGIGWSISDAASSSEKIRVEGNDAYDLPVMKLVASRDFTMKDQAAPVTLSGIYVYWFVAENELTESHWVRMRKMTTHLLATGELQRWAYVSYFAVCLPGEEAKTYARMKKFIAASVPEFQLAKGPPVAGAASPQAALR